MSNSHNAQIEGDSSSGYTLTILNREVAKGWFEVRNSSSDDLNVTIQGKSGGAVVYQDTKHLPKPTGDGTTYSAFLAGDDSIDTYVVYHGDPLTEIGSVTNITYTYNQVTLQQSALTTGFDMSTASPYVIVGSSNTVTVNADDGEPTVTVDGGAPLSAQGSGPYTYSVASGSELSVTSAGAVVQVFQLAFMSSSTATVYQGTNGGWLALPPVITPDRSGKVGVTLDPASFGLWFPGGSNNEAFPAADFTSSIAPDPSSTHPWILHIDVDGDPKILIKRLPPG
ncbi:diadenosine tetraphosphatase [Plesiocystis pacifica SIR-1]|uniref:Diadenosine tetraphosphatase n=1 Tax=Plesiocystis pacifica SIR-1 TaxID=391625 RepID=A6GG62_9BACT|nr:hypothetical protein [Plesiocystis pacifica]EDM75131.1 diadenosine tetraphosphatase [Plesiocystis pacifica SIR-1]